MTEPVISKQPNQPTPLANLVSDETTNLIATFRHSTCPSAAHQKAEREIRQRYEGISLTPLDIDKILRVERENAICDACTGLPCRKVTGCGAKREIKIIAQRVYTSVTPCEYVRAERRQMTVSKNFKAAKIPQTYTGKTFSDYFVDENNEIAVGWANTAAAEGAGVYFYGECGCGKTFLAAIVAQELLKQGKTVIFGDVPSLLDTLKATFGDGDTHIDDLMTALATVDVLVLDDLGTETPTEWAVERLYLIINQRYNADKQIIVTSNLAPSEAADKLNHPRNAPVGIHGTRIISRIKQMCRLAKIGGGDRRRK